MTYDTMLDSLNAKVAKFVGQIQTAEKSVDRMAATANGKLKNSFSTLTASLAQKSGTGPSASSTTSVMPSSMGSFTQTSYNGTSQSSQPTFNNVSSGGSSGGGFSGGSPSTFGKQNPSFGAADPSSPDASWANPKDAKGEIDTGGMGGPMLKVLAGLGSMAWQMTPGVRDAVAYQSSLFPVAFAASGQYAQHGSPKNFTIGRRINEAINRGASGMLDPGAAAAAMTYSGYTMNMGTTADKMLTQAGTMFQMTGMNNVASVQGSMSLSSGAAGIGDKLLGIGISTVGGNGNPRDIGAIIDQLWERWYGNKKVTEEQVDRDLAMGYVGADLQEFFGSSPALLQQAQMMIRLKAKEGGRSGIRLGLKSGDNSALTVAQKHGLSTYNSPMSALGDVNTSHANLLMQSSEGLLKGFEDSTRVEQGLSDLTSNLIAAAGAAADFAFRLKGIVQTSQSGPVTGGMVSGAIGMAAGLFADGGPIEGIGGTTADNINAKLSKGEYVINARAAKMIGKDKLNELNSLGHSSGSGYAHPAAVFAGGGEVNGQDVVNLATQYVGKVPYKHTGDDASPENGWDCSTFTHWVFKQFGVELPTYSDNYLSVGTEVDRSEIQPGDLLLWHTNDDKITGHVSIYAGNNQHIHAANPDVGTVRGNISQWYWDRFKGARRVSSSTLSPRQGLSVGSSGTDNPVEAQGAGLKAAYKAIGIKYDPKDTGQSGGLFTKWMRQNKGATPEAISTALQTMIGAYSNAYSAVMASGATDPQGNPKSTGSGAWSQDALPKDKLISILSQAGFEGEHLREAWAIVMRESSGNPSSHNPIPPDDSYGLFQINMYDKPGEMLGTERDTKKFPKYVQGYSGRQSLYDPLVNARAAAYMSKKGRDWSSWESPHYGSAADYYNQYSQSASHGMQNVPRDGNYNLHAGETIMPASLAQDFRDALREALGGGNRQPMNITLKIERASDEEAERFARKVKQILREDSRRERIGSA